MVNFIDYLGAGEEHLADYGLMGGQVGRWTGGQVDGWTGGHRKCYLLVL